MAYTTGSAAHVCDACGKTFLVRLAEIEGS